MTTKTFGRIAVRIAANALWLVIVIVAAAWLLAPSSAIAQSGTADYWDITGSIYSWETVADWSSNSTGVGGTAALPTSGSDVYFNGSSVNGTESVQLTAPEAVMGLYFNNTGATNLQLSSTVQNTLSIGTDGVTIAATAGVVTFGYPATPFELPVSLTGTQAWTNNSTVNAFQVISGISATGAYTLTVAGAGNTTFQALSAISGSIALNVATTGSGVVTLSGPNTYTGTTTITSGTLQIGSGGATGTMGTGTGALTDNGTLTIDLTTAFAIPNAIGGTGALTQLGSGATTLTGANSFAGHTTVTAGTLTVSGAGTLSGTTGLSVAAGATFNDLTATPGILTLGTGSTLTLANSSKLGFAVGDGIAASGAATVSGTVNVALSGSASSTTSYSLLAAASGLNAGTYSVLATNPGNYGYTTTVTPTAVTLNVTMMSALTNAYWVGGESGESNIWAISNGTASNWAATAGGPAQPLVPSAGTNVIISATTPTTAPTATVLGANMTINSLTIADTVNGLGLNSDGNTLTITPSSSATGITMNTGVPASTIAANLTLGAAQTWTNNSSNLLTVSTGAVTNGGNLLTIAGTGNTSISSIISGAGGLTMAGTGALTLGGANSFTGQVILNSGTVNVATWNASGANGVWGNQTNNASVLSTLITMNGATINETTASAGILSALRGVNIASGSNTINVLAGTTLNFNTAFNTFQFNGGTLDKTGAGQLDLGSSNIANNVFNASSQVTIDGGTLDWYGGGSMPTSMPLPLTIDNGGTFEMSFNLGSSVPAADLFALSGNAGILIPSSTHIINGVIANKTASVGNLNFTGSGTLVLTGTNTYSGTNTITSGTLQIGSGGATGTMGTGTGALTDNGTLTIDLTTAFAIPNAIGGTGALTQLGSGATTLTGANSFAGHTTVTAGTLTVSGAGTLSGTTGLSVAAGATFNDLTATPGILTLGTGSTLTLANSSKLGFAVGDGIAASGAATVSGTVNVALSGSASSTTSYSLLAAASGLNAGTYSVLATNPGNYGYTTTVTPTAVTLNVTMMSALTNAYWVGGESGESNIWAISNGTASNWAATAGGPAQPLVPSAGTNVIISATTPTTAPTATVLGANMTINSLTIADTVNGLGLNSDGNTLTITPSSSATGITMNTGVPASTIAANLTLGAAQTWTNNSSNLLTVSTGAVANGGFGLTVAGTGTTSISSAISGAGGLTVATTGSGALTLGGANTFTGAVNVNSGTVNVATWNAPSTNGVWGNNTNVSAATLIQMNGGTINYTGAAGTAGGLRGVNIASGFNTINVPASVTLDFNGGENTFQFNGGTLDKTGAGTLQLGDGGIFNNVFAASSRLIIDGGAVNWFGGGSAPNPSPTIPNAVTIDNGGTFQLSFPGTTSAVGAGVGFEISGSATFSVPSSAGVHGILGVIADLGANSRAQATTGSLVMSGPGELILYSANTYSGGTTVNSGTLATSGVGTIGTGTGPLAVNTSGGQNSQLTLVASQTVGNLSGTISGAGTDTISLPTAATALNVVQTTSNSFPGVISGSGGLTLGNGSTATLTLSGKNTYTGATTVDQGTLALNFSATGAPTTNIINNTVNTSGLVLGGAGTLAITGLASATDSQRFARLTVNAGSSEVQLTANVTSNPLLLSLGAITANVGGTVDFTLPSGTQSSTNGVTTTTTTVNNGVLATAGGTVYATATVSGVADWATVNGGNIVPYSTVSTYTETSAALNVPANYSSFNIDVDSSQSPTAAITPNTFRFSTAAPETLTLAAGANIVGAGGILETSNVNSNTSTISGGTLEGSSGGALVVIQDNTLGGLTINSAIADNSTATGLTKSGAGALTLGGANTFTGQVNLNGGTVNVATWNGPGVAGVWGEGTNASASTLIQMNGATINYTGATGTSSGLRGVNIASGFNTMVVPASTTLEFNSGQNNFQFNGGTLDLTGAGTLQLGASSLFNNVFNVNSRIIIDGGALDWYASGSMPNPASLVSNAVTINNGGTFELSYPGSNVVQEPNLGFAISGNATFLIPSSAGNEPIAGAISNKVGGPIGNLIMTGPGTLVLSGVETYTGTTTVTSGTLTVSGTGSLAATTGLSVGSGATFNYLPTTPGSLTLTGTSPALTLANNSTLGLAIGQSISTSGAASVGGAVTLYLSGSVIPGNSYTVLSAASGLDAGTYAAFVENPTNYAFSTSVLPGSVTLNTTTATALASAYWVGGLTGGTNVWALSNGSVSNWVATSGGAAQPLVPGAGANVVISSSPVTTAPTATVLGANMSINTLTIADTVNGLGLNADGNTLTITPSASTTGITMNSGVPASTIAASVALGAAQTWTNNSSHPLTVSGVVSGAAGLTIAGTGTVTLSGANSFTGGLTVAGGTLSVPTWGSKSTNGPFGNTASQITLGTATTSGTVIYTGGFQVLDQTGVGVNIAAGGGQVQVASGGTLEIGDSAFGSGGITGTGTLTIGGTGRLITVGGNNSFSGPVSISAGAEFQTNAVASVTETPFGAGSNGQGPTITMGANSILDVYLPSATTILLGSLNSTASTATARIETSGTLTLELGGDNSAASYAGTITPGSGTLSLIKQGTGTQILSGANTYNGGTTISGGTLRVANATSTSGTGTGTVTVGSTGTLAGSLSPSQGFITGAVTVNSGGTVSATNGDTLTLSGGLTLAGGSTSAFNLLTGSANANAMVATTIASGSSLTVSGSNAITLSGTPTAGNTYDLISFSGTAPSASSFTLPAAPLGTIYGLNVTASQVDLIVASNLTWTANGSTTWDTVTTNNWAVGNANATYADGENVVFNDTNATGGSAPTGAVIVQSGGVAPLSVTFSNSSVGYSLSSADSNGIRGTTGVAIQGSAGVTFNGPNTYIGTTSITGGWLQLGNANAVQNNTVTIGVTNGLTFTPLIGTFVLGGLSGTANESLQDTSLGAVTLQVGSNGANTAYSGSLSGSGSLTKVGAGVLTLSGSSNYSGGTTIQNGTLRAGALNTLPTTGTVTFAAVSGAATLDLNANGLTVGGLAITSGAASNAVNQIITNSNSSGTATLTYNGGASTFAGTLTDGGSGKLLALTLSGGTLTLNGANTYTGATAVNSGTLRVASPGSLASAVTVGSAATLAGSGTIGGLVSINALGILAPSGTTPSVSTTMTLTGGLTLATGATPGSGSILDFNLSSPGSGDVVKLTSGTLALGAYGILNINSNGGGGELGIGDYPLVDYTGSPTGDASTWGVSNTGGDSGHNYSFITSVGTGPGGSNQFDLMISNSSSSGTWSSSGDMNYGTASNWSSGEIPNGAGLVATFGTGSQMSVTVNGSYTVGQLVFNNSIASASYDLSGGTLMLDNSGSGASVNVGSGGLSPTISTALTLADSSMTTTFNVASNSSLDLAGTINESTSPGQKIVLTGGGQLTMDHNNSYTGGTTVQNGTLVVNSSGGLGTGSLTFNPGSGNTAVVNVNTNMTVNNLSQASGSLGAAQLNISSGDALTLNQTASANFNGTLSLGYGGALVLNQGSTNTLTISGAAVLADETSISVNSGTLALTNNTNSGANITGNPTASVAPGATLQLAGSSASLSSAVSITTHGTGLATDGALTVVGNTTQTVGIITGDTVSASPATTYSGNTTVGDGTNAANLTATQILQNTLTINAGSTVTIAPSGSDVESEELAGAATAAPSALATSAAIADSGSDSGSDPFTAIQAAIASGSISSVKGQQLENRIAAIERLAATDPGLDVSLLEDRVLAAIPPLSPEPASASLVETGSSLLAVDSDETGSTLAGATAAFAPAGGFGASPAAVPEPSTLLLAALGGIGVLIAVRRRSICCE